MGRKNKSFVMQSLILTASSIVVRIIGLIYRIPLMNTIGSDGMGYYAVAFNLYTIMLLISSYSVPLAVSKMVSARMAQKKMRNSYKVFLGSLCFSFVIGLTAALVTYFGADLFAKIWNSSESALALKILSPGIAIMSVLGVLRGYFNGLGNMLPMAISQVLEQIVNAVVSVLAAKKMYDFALASSDLNEYGFGAAGGTLGTVLGSLIATLFLVFVFILYRKNVIIPQNRRDGTLHNERYRDITKILIITILPVVFNTAIYHLSSLTDSGVFNNIMSFRGVSEVTYTGIWGTYEGSYKIITTVPIAFANALSVSIIPTLSAAISRGNIKMAKDRIEMGIRLAMIIAIPSTIGLAILAKPIMEMLFGNGKSDVELASNLMRWGSSMILVYSLSTLSNAILQGANRIRIPVKNSFISFVIHLIVLVPLLFFTDLGIYAVVFANIIFALSVSILNAIALRREIDYHQEIRRTFFFPLLASAFMGIVTYLTYYMIQNAINNNLFATIFSIILSVIIYSVLLLKFKVIHENELLAIPKGYKVLNIARKFHLM